ncbi:tetratricopeptide repeat protein [Paludisphaera borealis]|uniref:tetratricopeptide repeat protein n=1 Tax=Paludisphaera borealis TaxID=1387353 RepID=UPI000970D438|nr:tetratricopeptide repeat protein [Paludisphaera borealis]
MACLFGSAAMAFGFAAFLASNYIDSAWRLARGRAAYTRGEWAESVKGAREVLKKDPGNQGALVLLARSFARSGRDDQALAVYQRIDSAALESLDYLLIGDGCSKLGQEPMAVSAWLDAERLAPNDPQTLFRLALYSHKEKQPLEALPRARKLASDPKLGLRGAWIEARIYSDLDEPESASTPLERVLKVDAPSLRTIGIERSEVASLAARVNLRLGRPERALEILDSASGGERNRESRWLASRAFLQQGKASEVASALAAVIPPMPPLAREPAPYTSAVSCRPCHASIYESQQYSRHALTFQDRWKSPTASKHKAEGEIPDPISTRVRHRLTNDHGTTTLETTVDDQTYRAIVQYVLGSGNHGETLVVKDAHDELREGRVSYHAKQEKWSKTIGHTDLPPDAIGYLGRPITEDFARKCVHCHTTTASSVLTPAPERPHDRGIGCERCHGPGGNHLKAIALGLTDRAIVRPSAATADEVTNLCAQCHSPVSPTMSPDSPDFIRFQAPSLVKSRCYKESGSLSCVSCHNPHQNVATSSTAYEAVCLKCHSATKDADPTSRGARDASMGAICPVNQTEGCLNCHMPKIPEAVPNAEFTDHFIRVREDSSAGGPRPNRRQ